MVEVRPNPFRLLLKGIGIDRDDLGPLTNGDLMRIAEVDPITFHGWMYLGPPCETRDVFAERLLYLGKDLQQGSYLLRIRVAEALCIPFGRFKGGKLIAIEPGPYSYVGSSLAQSGATCLARRLIRHATRTGDRVPQPIAPTIVTLPVSESILRRLSVTGSTLKRISAIAFAVAMTFAKGTTTVTSSAFIGDSSQRKFVLAGSGIPYLALASLATAAFYKPFILGVEPDGVVRRRPLAREPRSGGTPPCNPAGGVAGLALGGDRRTSASLASSAARWRARSDKSPSACDCSRQAMCLRSQALLPARVASPNTSA